MNALAAFSMKKYQQQNNYVTILAKLQATDFCDREIPDLQIFIVHREWISIALGPGHTSLVPSLETETWIKSVDIITDYFVQAPSISTQLISDIHMFVEYSSKHFVWFLSKTHQKMSQEMQSSMFRSAVTLLCVSRIMSQL